MKHRWKQQRWWTRALAIIPIAGTTKTCLRCGAKLRTTKRHSLVRRGTFASSHEYHNGVVPGFFPVRRIPPCVAGEAPSGKAPWASSR